MNGGCPFNKRGDWLVLVVWILLCWPVAVVYFFMRSWGYEANERLDWELKKGWHD